MFPKHIQLSLEGLDFLNCCLQHDPNERMSWDDLLKHNYLNYDHNKFITEETTENDLMLSFIKDSSLYSAIMQTKKPHNQFNRENAIMLNTKNP